MSFEDFPKNFLLVGLFLVSIISFATIIGANYGHDESFMKDDKINLGQIQEEVESTNAQASGWEKSFTSDNLFVQLGSIVLFSIWGIMLLIWSAIFGMFNLIFQLGANVFGLPPIVTGTIGAIMIISLIFAGWRTLKAGE